MQNNIVSSNYISVSVGGRVFQIPAHKVNELVSILAGWQSLSVSEQSSPTQNTYPGKSLIFG